MLQVPGTGTRTGYVRVRRGPRTSVLQVRRKRTSCPLCESLEAPANHRMGGVACAPPPPKTKRKRPVREPAPAAKTQGSTAEVAVDGREEAMELAQ